MPFIKKIISYKGYRIRIWKDAWGYYSAHIDKYRKDSNYNFKDYYFVKRVDEQYNSPNEAKIEAKKYINSLKKKGGK